ncbi:hypothetical protein Aspvir_004138 [Aspergillus viridinutans]|uniref:Uncharacterized protein n=1 Tax=Aspergillus viridinutans TaxID=75553 RepID=A0A9P3BPW5_ASPVI|nr:uncharacterized protein Aspvir_004138 [Aspergillus viridinutans]GIK00120.1 hypothetical protein Aspvir_004138 [Aspergillus viridinutans]
MDRLRLGAHLTLTFLPVMSRSGETEIVKVSREASRDMPFAWETEEVIADGDSEIVISGDEDVNPGSAFDDSE